MRDFDPRARIAFALLLLGLVGLIVVLHGPWGLMAAAELSIPALGVAAWVGGTGWIDWRRSRGR